MEYDARLIAEYFLWRDAKEGDDRGITHLKLQKLLYYAQGFNLAINGAPIFTDPVLAWEHGPVVESVYHRYKGSGTEPIVPSDRFDPKKIDPEARELLDEVYDVYGQYSAWRLRDMTHKEAPWVETRQNAPISEKAMKEFFKAYIRDNA